jgi:hypothetical protein
MSEKAKPVRIEPGGGYVECPVGEATHVTINMPGPIGMLTLPVILRGSRAGTNAWTWNGDTEAPTLRPSVRSTRMQANLCCHSWINDGYAQFLDDTTHELRGQTVPLLDVPEPMD